jgi:uncharacterized protein YlxP (DUF503 family)
VLRIHGATSLKDRRSVVQAVVARLRNKFNAAGADLDKAPEPRTALLGIVCVANDSRHLDRQLTAILAYVESVHLPLEVVGETREVLQI